MGSWFTDRRGGVSEAPYSSLNLAFHVGDDPAAVAENRRRLHAVVGDRPIVWMDQVHGRNVAVVGGPVGTAAAGPAPDAVPETDALITTTPGLVLAVMAADCVPVLLRGEGSATDTDTDPVMDTAPGAGATRIVAAAHAGRRGLQLGVLEAVVSRMSAMGVQPRAVEVQLGPAVCGRCYEVPAAMRDEVAAVAPAARATTRAGRPALDLRAGLVQQLHALGVQQVHVDPRCTMEDPLLFSHRRDQRTGRLAGLVVIDD